MDEEYEIAEEVARLLEYFADALERGHLDAATRKMMRDQAYQGRTRSRADLSARGSTGGSAKGLDVAKSTNKGVVLVCAREGGSFVVKTARARATTARSRCCSRGRTARGGRALRGQRGRGQRARHVLPREGPRASLRPRRGAQRTRHVGLQLDELFVDGGEPWNPVLRARAKPDEAAFIGPKRDPNIVPVRELTFQALKPNPRSGRW